MSVNEIALLLGVIILAGIISGKTFQKMKAPMIIGFLLAGILFGPSFLNIITAEISGKFELLKMITLGVIAYTIGGELNIKRTKQILRSIFVIAIVQIIATFVLVFVATYYLLGFSFPISLLLGAIAPASAPASPLAVCREYQADGPFTTTLLGTVAFLDVAVLTLFAVVSAFAAVILKGQMLTGGFLTIPLLEIGGSVVLGLLVGIIIIFAMRRIDQKPWALAFLLGVVLLNIGLAGIWHLSPLLVNMAAGIAVTNLSSSHLALHAFEDIEIPLYITFFFLAGVDLRLGVLVQTWAGAATYIIARGTGKVGGTFLGAKLAKSEKQVQKFLGFGMLSKAGLSIGLVIMVQQSFPEIAEQITAIVLGAVAVSTLIGPLGEKFALLSSGECKIETRETTEEQSY